MIDVWNSSPRLAACIRISPLVFPSARNLWGLHSHNATQPPGRPRLAHLLICLSWHGPDRQSLSQQRGTPKEKCHNWSRMCHQKNFAIHWKMLALVQKDSRTVITCLHLLRLLHYRIRLPFLVEDQHHEFPVPWMPFSFVTGLSCSIFATSRCELRFRHNV